MDYPKITVITTCLFQFFPFLVISSYISCICIFIIAMPYIPSQWYKIIIIFWFTGWGPLSYNDNSHCSSPSFICLIHKHNHYSLHFIISLSPSLSVCLFSVSSTDLICHSAIALSDLPFLEVLCSSLPLKGLTGSENALESLRIFNAIDLQ